MFTIKDERYEYIPIQYNMAWYKNEQKGNEILLKNEFIERITEYCETNNVYIWDCHNMSSISDRGLDNSFKMLSNRNIVLANVIAESALDKAVRHGIALCGGKLLFQYEEIRYYCLNGKREHGVDRETIQNIIKRYLNELIDKKCIEKKYQYLVSSGVYSNMQINLKKLFYDIENFPYIIYLLWDQIYQENFDGIIATSKNGVAFVSVLGGIFGCDVLYFNIGQMFEETYNCSPQIKKRGRYIHIYDMICLGSETKVLNALVNAQGGEVIKSIGIVCLLDLEAVAKWNRYSSINKVKCLIGQKDLQQEYVISLKKNKEENCE